MLELRRRSDNSIITQLVESEIVARFVASYWRKQGTKLIPSDPIREAKMNLFIQTFMD